MAQSSEETLASAAMVKDLAARAKVAAAFLEEAGQRRRMLRIAKWLEQEAARLEAKSAVLLQAHRAGTRLATIYGIVRGVIGKAGP